MSALIYERCFRHPGREAAARCRGCARSFCRECITEHADTVLCVSCLSKEEASEASPGRSRLLPLSQYLLGLAAAWVFFYLLGRGLLLLPTTFHEGTIVQDAAASGDGEE